MNKRGKLLGALGALAIVGVIGVGALYYFVIRNDSPDAVSIDNAIEAARQTTPGGTTASNSSASGDDRDRAMAGTWNVVQGANSFVGYRVQEELAGIGSTVAVGRSNGIQGNLNFDGDKITGVQITADLTQLKSDKSQRDGQLRRQSIETDKFPSATFALSTPIDIKDVPAAGSKITQDVKGKLTLHGVTKDVSLSVQGVIDNNQVIVVGSTTIMFADYNIQKPQAQSVLGVEDKGVMEFQLVFAKAA
jgi:polyisoprenoid-binding protein YceI